MPATILQTNKKALKKVKVDTVTIDIIESALRNARFEMDTVLFRTAMSPGIREQHENARAFAEDAKDIRGPDIAGADRTDVDPFGAGHQIAGGDRPEQISGERGAGDGGHDHDDHGGEVGRTAVAIATSKASLAFGVALARGVLCNALVCLAVWLTYSARTTTDRILAIVPPIAAFVAGVEVECRVARAVMPARASVSIWAPRLPSVAPVSFLRRTNSSPWPSGSAFSAAMIFSRSGWWMKP